MALDLIFMANRIFVIIVRKASFTNKSYKYVYYDLIRSFRFPGNEFEGHMMANMTFTIEPILCLGNPSFKILSDEWTAVTRDKSRTAQFEHTILITKSGCEILTVPDSFDKQNGIEEETANEKVN